MMWSFTAQIGKAIYLGCKKYLSLSEKQKCKLDLRSETNYLSYAISRGLVKLQEAKLSAIQDWPKPVTKKKVRSFLSLANYYRRFIPNFAMMAAPLTDLTMKKQSRMLRWTPVAEEVYGNLKRLC